MVSVKVRSTGSDERYKQIQLTTYFVCTFSSLMVTLGDGKYILPLFLYQINAHSLYYY